MSFREYVVELERRRSITRSFTWKIALPFWKIEKQIKKWRKQRASTSAKKASAKQPDAFANACKVVIGGGIGDTLVSAAFLHKFGRERNLRFKVYSSHPGLGKIISNNQAILRTGGGISDPSMTGVLSVSINHFLSIPENIAPEYPIKSRLTDRIFEVINDSCPHLDGTCTQLAEFFGYDRYSILNWQTGFDFSQQDLFPLLPDPAALAILARHNLRPGAYLTLGGGVDQVHFENSLGGDPNRLTTKQLTPANWERVVHCLKKTCPSLKLVAVGSNGPKINVDLDLRRATSLDEAAWILKWSAAHIDIEGGLVHLAHHLSTRSLVFFGPTPIKYFGYDENINLVSELCSNCYWKTDDWLFRCPKGFETPICLKDVDEAKIEKGISRIIKRPKKVRLLKLKLFSQSDYNEKYPLLREMAESAQIKPPPPEEHAHSDVSGAYIHSSKQWEYPVLFQQLRAYFHEKKLSVADVGSGRGAFSSYLAKLGHQVRLYDINYDWDKHTAQAPARFSAWCKSLGIQQEYAGAYNVPAPESSFDCAISVSVLEHLEHKFFVLLELIRLVKPGGLILLSFDITKIEYKDSARVEVFTPSSLLALLDEVGVAQPQPLVLEPSIDQSIAEIQQACILGIPPGMSVGMLALVVE